jgi:hypothetical protein
MSWIDIYLSDGNPRSVYGADVERALTSMMRLRDVPFIAIGYARAGLRLRDAFAFTLLDVVRNLAYRRGFSSGEVGSTETNFL